MKTINNKNKFKISWLMFRLLLPVFAILLLMTSCKKEEAAIGPWYPETNANGDALLAVFESRIPCSDCERLKLGLAIYGNAQTNLPSTYMMSRIYVGKNNDRVSNSGNMIVTQGTSLDPLHTVYRLTSGAPVEYQSYWRINEDLLFILDANLTPKVGDAGHGYVLNRIR